MSDLETIIVCNGESRDERNQYEAIRADKVTAIYDPQSNYNGPHQISESHNPKTKTWVWIKGFTGENLWTLKRRRDWEDRYGFDLTPLYEWEEVMPTKPAIISTFQELVAEYASKPERSMQTRIFEILNHETFWGRDEDIQIQIFRERFINNPEFCSAGIQRFLDWIPPKWAEKLKPNRKVITATLLIEAPMNADPNEQLDSIMDFLNDWINPHSGFTGVDYRDIGEEDYLG